MKRNLLFTLLTIMSALLLLADLEVSPFDYNMVGPAYTGETITFFSDTLYVTNTGASEEFTIHLETGEMPDGWSVMWCHEYEDALCHFPIFPWSFEFVSDTEIAIDFTVSYSSSPAMFNLDLYWESARISEVMNFTFRTEDYVDTNEDGLQPVIRLSQNYPNPFNPETTISFSITEQAEVELNIYDLKGRLIKNLINSELTSGEHSFIWGGIDDRGIEVPSGVYLYRIITGTDFLTRKMILMK